MSYRTLIPSLAILISSIQMPEEEGEEFYHALHNEFTKYDYSENLFWQTMSIQLYYMMKSLESNLETFGVISWLYADLCFKHPEKFAKLELYKSEWLEAKENNEIEMMEKIRLIVLSNI